MKELEEEVQEQTYETGGEVLRVGDTVIVFDENRHRELKITSIGRKRVHIESLNGYRPVPYDKETRKSQQGAYGSYFRTKTEVAEQQHRALLKSQLRDLGIEARIKGNGDGLDPYSNAVLEQLVEYLSDQLALANRADSQAG